MPLTEEQQNQLDFQEASETLRNTTQSQLESDRRSHELTLELRRTRLETIRLAKETLIEVARSKPVDQREISADNVISFSTLLENHINR